MHRLLVLHDGRGRLGLLHERDTCEGLTRCRHQELVLRGGRGCLHERREGLSKKLFKKREAGFHVLVPALVRFGLLFKTGDVLDLALAGLSLEHSKHDTGE
jgi:hypothetical protein